MAKTDLQHAYLAAQVARLAATPEGVHRPGSLPGTHRVSAMLAAHLIYAPYKDFSRWPKASQDAQIESFHAATVRAGIVWW